MIKNNNLKLVLCVCSIAFIAMTSVFSDTEYKIRSTDNLSRIVNKHYQGSDLSRSQILVGILAKNPSAFRGGNINYLIRGKRLILPDENTMPGISEEDAIELLSEHARYFRNGVTGNLKPPFASNSRVLNNNSTSLETRQVVQSKKINQLEKESGELRLRLEALVAEKKSRDDKLRDIEAALKGSLDPSNPTDRDTKAMESKKKLTEQVDLKTKEIQESNKVLQRELQESKSELAENTRENISLERQISNLKNESNQIDGSKLNTDVDNKNTVSGDTTNADKVNFGESLGFVSKNNLMLFALLSLLGLLFWRWSWSKKRKVPTEEGDLKQALEDAYREEENYSDEVEHEELPLEPSVKLDVARAYIEATDAESAVSILLEVVEEGNEMQRQQAQEILGTLQQTV